MAENIHNKNICKWILQILTEPKNALAKQYHKLFELEGVEIDFRKDALRQIAKRAIQRKTGARGLRSIVEHTLLDLMYELPTVAGLKKVVIDAGVIDQVSSPLFIYEHEKASRKVAQEYLNN